MACATLSRFVTLLRREFREYKTAFFWTPIIAALVLLLLMSGSAVLADGIRLLSDVLLASQAALKESQVEVTLSAAALSGRELTLTLNLANGILMLILMTASGNYLLSCLYDDRKDRSILFWRSLPVSESEVVLSKFVMVIVVAPLIYIAISMLLQVAFVLLTVLKPLHHGDDAVQMAVANLDFFALAVNPISGWVLTALWIAPLYAYLLLASAAAKRSPFMLAILPVLGLVVVEGAFFGSGTVRNVVQNHIPHFTGGSAFGFYLFSPDWLAIDLSSVAGGLLFAVLALTATAYLRRYRWEL